MNWPWWILGGLLLGAVCLGRWYTISVLVPRYQAIVARACEKFAMEKKDTEPLLRQVVGDGSPVMAGQQQVIFLVFEKEDALLQIEQEGRISQEEKRLRQLLLEEGYPASLVDVVQVEWVTARTFAQTHKKRAREA